MIIAEVDQSGKLITIWKSKQTFTLAQLKEDYHKRIDPIVLDHRFFNFLQAFYGYKRADYSEVRL